MGGFLSALGLGRAPGHRDLGDNRIRDWGHDPSGAGVAGNRSSPQKAITRRPKRHPSRCLAGAAAHPSDPPSIRCPASGAYASSQAGASASGRPSEDGGRRATRRCARSARDSRDAADGGVGPDAGNSEDVPTADRGSPSALGDPALVRTRARPRPDPAPPGSRLRTAGVAGRYRQARPAVPDCRRGRART